MKTIIITYRDLTSREIEVREITVATLTDALHIAQEEGDTIADVLTIEIG